MVVPGGGPLERATPDENSSVSRKRVQVTDSWGISPLTRGHMPGDVTALLIAWRNGDKGAADKLMPMIYGELHQQAERAMRRENPGNTLQATALVNEAYLKLVDQSRVQWQNRAHFLGVAAQIMRRVLVDHARGRLADKRGAGAAHVTLDDVHAGASDEGVGPLDLLALNDALEKLAALDPTQARVVELRYFTDLTIEETAEAMGTSPATVKRELAVARAWLKRELEAH